MPFLLKSEQQTNRAMITGGKSLVSSAPAFASDGKRLLVCTGNTVSIFSVSTGLQITELEGHTALVTSVIVVPVAASASKLVCYCWTSSMDGTICYWDFSVPELVKKVEVKLPIFSMVIPNISSSPVDSNGKPMNLYAFIYVHDIHHKSDHPEVLHGQVRLCNLTKGCSAGGPLAEAQNPKSLVVSNSGEFFGMRKKKKLLVWKVPAKDFRYDEVKRIALHHTKKLTALAFHPTERILAGGDVTGRILIWRGFGKREFSQNRSKTSGGKVADEEEAPGVRNADDADSCSTWHWHSTKVKFLSFSSDGAYLYSGGKEGVLVVWQLDSEKKRFFPRIGSPLLYFADSPDPSLSAISCADNQIHLLKMPSIEIVKSIPGIKLPYSVPEIYRGLWNNGFAFDHKAGLVAVRTETYCIQFYNLFYNREVSQVRVCERNYQPVDDMTVVVSLIALSLDGAKMATVEVKLPEEEIGGLVCLKFWASGSQSGEYALSTIIYEPHSDAGISALAFRPTHNMAVSSSYGSNFKIWVCSHSIQPEDGQPQKSGWRCQSVGSYKKMPMTAAGFSTDGSVLAVAAGTVVTLWNPDTNVLVAVIGETLTPIVSLSFIGSSEHLVSISRGSKPQLSVWNLSKLSLSWSYQLIIEAIACMIDSSQFAVLALLPKAFEQTTHETALENRDGLILLFDVENPVPVALWSVKKAKGGGLAFLKAGSFFRDEKPMKENLSEAMLVYLNGDHEYVIFDPFSRQEYQTGANPRDRYVPLEDTGRSGFESIYGELPEFNSKLEEIPPAPFVPSDRPWETIFSGSSHILPPLTKLCSTFLAALLEKNPTLQQ